MLSVFKAFTSSSLPQVASGTLEERVTSPSYIHLQRLFPIRRTLEFQTSIELWDVYMPYTTDFMDPMYHTFSVTFSDLKLHPRFHPYHQYDITIPGAYTRCYIFLGTLDLNPNDYNGEE